MVAPRGICLGMCVHVLDLGRVTFGLGGGNLMAEYEMLLITSVSELSKKKF